MKREQRIIEAVKILEAITSIGHHGCLNDDGSLDVYTWNQLDLVRDTKRQLKKIGYKSNKQLSSEGFIAAGLVLRF